MHFEPYYRLHPCTTAHPRTFVLADDLLTVHVLNIITTINLTTFFPDLTLARR